MLQRFSYLPLQTLARSSGFVLRRPKKLSLDAFLQSILLSLCSPAYSFQSWAAQLSALQAGLFSKQALHQRCDRRLLGFLQLCFGQLVSQFYAPLLPQSAVGTFRPSFAPGQHRFSPPSQTGELFSGLW